MELKTQSPAHKLSARAQDDYNYVQKAIEGDQKAYAVLMDRYRNSIYHMMYKMVKNRDDSDDLTLEAFGKAFAKLHSYEPGTHFQPGCLRLPSIIV